MRNEGIITDEVARLGTNDNDHKGWSVTLWAMWMKLDRDNLTDNETDTAVTTSIEVLSKSDYSELIKPTAIEAVQYSKQYCFVVFILLEYCYFNIIFPLLFIF